jgi:light-regulated signal transduction histidine kinase (bacteriophytochrome)
LGEVHGVQVENVQVYTELEQRVRDRTRKLQAANQELEAFAYTLSHDLRTSLTALKGFNGLLQFQYAKQLTGKGKTYVTGIATAVNRINSLIEGMLVLYPAKHSEIQLQTTDLSRMAQEAMADLQARSPERVVEVAISDSLTTQGDPTLLRLVLENLLSNAWKYSIKAPQPRIEFGYNEEFAAFYVKDNGAGFDMQQADKLFQPFQRLHNYQEFPGIGVGLASVARIIERHSWQIWADAKPDQGATFFFTLPIIP